MLRGKDELDFLIVYLVGKVIFRRRVIKWRGDNREEVLSGVDGEEEMDTKGFY